MLVKFMSVLFMILVAVISVKFSHIFAEKDQLLIYFRSVTHISKFNISLVSFHVETMVYGRVLYVRIFFAV